MERHSLVKDFLMEQERPGRIARAAGVVSGATLLSRILGFVRDLIIARAFGAGTATDAFFAAFRLPNMLRELLGEGALSAAFIPVREAFTRGRERLAAGMDYLDSAGSTARTVSIEVLACAVVDPPHRPGFRHPVELHLAIYAPVDVPVYPVYRGGVPLWRFSIAGSPPRRCRQHAEHCHDRVCFI
jgi:hypothetical protein